MKKQFKNIGSRQVLYPGVHTTVVTAAEPLLLCTCMTNVYSILF